MSAPLVTIAIPTYDRLPYLREAVASGLAQTYASVEVLIADDGPTREIGEFADAARREDPRVRYVKNPRNLGLAGSWNVVADHARGERIVIIGDDDRLLPEFVERLLAADPEADVLFSEHHLIDAEGRRLEEEGRRHARRYGREELPAGRLADPVSVVWRNSVPMSAALVRTADVRRLRFKEDLNTPEIELFARHAAAGATFTFVREHLAEYRVHARSATTAGLRGEELVKYLSPIDVPPHVEPLKRVLLAELLLNAVSHCLVQGDRARARSFAEHPAFPRRASARALGLEVFAALPRPLGTGLFRALRALRSRASR